MKKFKFQATNLITSCFNDYDVNYNVIESDDSEQILSINIAKLRYIIAL